MPHRRFAAQRHDMNIILRYIPALLIAATLLSACATPLQWANIDPAELESLGSGQWLSDLRALRDGMSKHPKMNGDPATRARFDAALREAENAIAGIRAPDSGKAGASLSDTAVAGIMKAVAAMGDGHTRLNTSFRTLYPAAMRFFSREGGWDLVLAAAAPAWGSYVGMTVAKIGGRDIPEAAAIVSEYLSLESGLAHRGGPVHQAAGDRSQHLEPHGRLRALEGADACEKRVVLFAQGCFERAVAAGFASEIRGE